MKIGRVSIIVAASSNLVIGKNNDIPWNIPSDLKSFKRITGKSPVIMGRNTWESIPEKYRPLPNRTNIVLSRNHNYKAEGATVIGFLATAIEDQICDNDEIFIIGGSHIYKEGFQYANKLYMTEVLQEIEGDVKLEGFDPSEWKLTSSSEVMEENGYKFRFNEYDRILGQI